jgi:hypothetical protein
MNIEDSNIDELNTRKINTVMAESDDRVLCVKIDRPISTEGYKINFLDRVDAMLAAHGEIRFLLYFEEYKGWDSEAAKMDMTMLAKYGGKVRKFALVNPPSKEIFRNKINQPLRTGETRYFTKDELADALVWVRE